MEIRRRGKGRGDTKRDRLLQSLILQASKHWRRREAHTHTINIPPFGTSTRFLLFHPFFDPESVPSVFCRHLSQGFPLGMERDRVRMAKWVFMRNRNRDVGIGMGNGKGRAYIYISWEMGHGMSNVKCQRESGEILAGSFPFSFAFLSMCFFSKRERERERIENVPK